MNLAALAAATLALSYVGLVEADAKDAEGHRKGWEHLHTIFSEACAKSFYTKNMQHSVKHGGSLPHWCGIFTNFACLRAGATKGKWPSPGFINWKAHDFKQIGIPNPKPGDVMNAPDRKNHFALCLNYDSTSRMVTTIDGNTSPSGGASGRKSQPPRHFRAIETID